MSESIRVKENTKNIPSIGVQILTASSIIQYSNSKAASMQLKHINCRNASAENWHLKDFIDSLYTSQLTYLILFQDILTKNSSIT